MTANKKGIKQTQEAQEKLSVLLLTDSDSTHSKKFIEGYAKRDDIDAIYVFSLTANSILSASPKIQVISHEKRHTKLNPFSKFTYYLSALSKLKKLLKQYPIDITHAHFATSYGLLAALAVPKQFILSVWGSDIFVYPNQSTLLRRLITFNLSKAKLILSTSHVMKEACQKLTKTDILVTPFGINTDRFKPLTPDTPLFPENTTVIGCIKRLETVAGVDILINAFHQLLQTNHKDTYQLLIVGMGSQFKHLNDLVNTLGIEKNVHFTQYVEPEKIPHYHNMMDIEVYPSRHESFGVSIIEAMACKKPVIVANTEGLPEVVDHNKTGIIVPQLKEKAFYQAMKDLLADPKKQNQLGEEARKNVISNYNFEDTLDQIISIYKSVKSTRT